MNFDLHQIRNQIATLRLNHPELVEDDEAWVCSLESETDLTEMLRKIERKRQEAKALAEGLSTLLDDATKRRERFKMREQNMRDLAFKLMQAADLKSMEFPEATLSVVHGQQKLIITNEELIPNILCKITRVPDKARLKEMLKAGQTVLGATLSNAETHLTIRTK